MPYSTTNPRFDALLKRLGELHDRKNAGYANAADPLANFKIANRFGLSTSMSIAVRLSDKINRWLNLMEKPELDLVGEAQEETMDDLVVYGMLWLVAREEEKEQAEVEWPAEDSIVVAWTPEQYAVRHELFDKPTPLTEEDIMLAPPAMIEEVHPLTDEFHE